MSALATVGIKLETGSARSQLKGLTQESKKTQTAFEGVAGKARNAKGQFVGVGAAAKTAGAGTALLGKASAGAVGGVRALGLAMRTALGPIALLTTAAGALSSAFSVLTKQDFAEAKVKSLGVNADALKANLKGVSRELSGQASVVELTGAAYDVASAGFNNAADASNILKAASLGATGGFSDINTVGDAATSVLNAYGKTADEAGALVDGFIQTQNDGKIVIGEYAANIAKVAPVAAALGVPLEEVNAAVAQITAGGQGAEVTFTALKTAFAQVAAGKVGKEFEALGVEINASTLKSDGLAGTLEKIKKSGADAGTVIKAFGTEAGPSILALLNNTEKYNQLLENQKNAQGAAAKAAFIASDTVNGQLKRLSTAFENLFADQSALGELLKQIFKIAAVTVEFFAAALQLVIAPAKFIFTIVSEIGKAIAQALGIEGVGAAQQLEEGFQSVLETMENVANFVTGLGIRIGRVIGGVYSRMISGGAEVRNNLVNIFGNTFENIVNFIKGAYNNLPPVLRVLLEKAAGIGKGIAAGISSFVTETIALGSGASSTGSGKKGTPETAASVANNVVSTGGGKGVTSKTSTGLSEADKERLRIAREVAKLEADAFKAQEKKQAAYQKEYESIDDQRMLLEGMLRGNEKEVKNNILKRDLLREHGEEKGNILYQNALNVQQLQQQVNKQAELNAAQEAAGKKLDEMYAQIGSRISTGIVDALTSAVDGTKKLADVATDLLKDLGNMLIQMGIQGLLGSISGPAGSLGGLLGKMFGGGMAKGGSVSSNKSYLVGEKGPELFSPSSSGSIIPNHAMGGGGGSIVVNVDASGSKAEGDDERSKALGKALGTAVRSELIKQKRPGGILA